MQQLVDPPDARLGDARDGPCADRDELAGRRPRPAPESEGTGHGRAPHRRRAVLGRGEPAAWPSGSPTPAWSSSRATTTSSPGDPDQILDAIEPPRAARPWPPAAEQVEPAMAAPAGAGAACRRRGHRGALRRSGGPCAVDGPRPATRSSGTSGCRRRSVRSPRSAVDGGPVPGRPVPGTECPSRRQPMTGARVSSRRAPRQQPGVAQLVRRGRAQSRAALPPVDSAMHACTLSPPEPHLVAKAPAAVRSRRGPGPAYAPAACAHRVSRRRRRTPDAELRVAAARLPRRRPGGSSSASPYCHAERRSSRASSRRSFVRRRPTSSSTSGPVAEPARPVVPGSHRREVVDRQPADAAACPAVAASSTCVARRAAGVPRARCRYWGWLLLVVWFRPPSGGVALVSAGDLPALASWSAMNGFVRGMLVPRLVGPCRTAWPPLTATRHGAARRAGRTFQARSARSCRRLRRQLVTAAVIIVQSRLDVAGGERPSVLARLAPRAACEPCPGRPAPAAEPCRRSRDGACPASRLRRSLRWSPSTSTSAVHGPDTPRQRAIGSLLAVAVRLTGSPALDRRHSAPRRRCLLDTRCWSDTDDGQASSRWPHGLP